MKQYVFRGSVRQGRSTQPFEREVEGESMDHARDNLLSQLSSEHSIRRTAIEIEEEENA